MSDKRICKLCGQELTAHTWDYLGLFQEWCHTDYSGRLTAICPKLQKMHENSIASRGNE